MLILFLLSRHHPKKLTKEIQTKQIRFLEYEAIFFDMDHKVLYGPSSLGLLWHF
jgi:hypothetical protein